VPIHLAVAVSLFPCGTPRPRAQLLNGTLLFSVIIDSALSRSMSGRLSRRIRAIHPSGGPHPMFQLLERFGVIGSCLTWVAVRIQVSGVRKVTTPPGPGPEISC
jgi:hypothetical protein